MAGVNARWHESYFGGLALEFWERAHPPEVTRAEAEFLLGELAMPPGGALLDVPCGDGRLALEIAGRGHAVAGTDSCAELIHTATARATERGLPAEFRHGDMRVLDWAEGFDGVACFGNSFGYFDARETQAFLFGVSEALRPGGRFVLDTGTAAESILPNLEERTWMPVDGGFLLSENEYHAPESRLDSVHTFIDGGRSEARQAHHWVFTVGEIGRMLAETGLAVQHTYSTMERLPYFFGAPRLLLVAEKAGIRAVA